MLFKVYILLLYSVVLSISTAFDESKLIGRWTYDMMLDGDVRMVGFTVYNKDQSFYGEAEFTHEGHKVDSMRVRGTWELVGSSFVIKGTVIDNPEIEEMTIEAKMLELSENRLRYQTPDGKVYEEYRSK